MLCELITSSRSAGNAHHLRNGSSVRAMNWSTGLSVGPGADEVPLGYGRL